MLIVSSALINGLMKVIIRQSLGVDISSHTLKVEQMGKHLMKKIQAMPILIQWPMTVLMMIFQFYVLLRFRKLFSCLTIADQQRVIQSWQGSPIKVFREFIQFFEKLTLFIYYS